MSIDNSSSSSIEPKKSSVSPSQEDIKKSEQDGELLQKITHINNILQVLDLPANIEDDYRRALESQNPTTLKQLAGKSKTEIILFLMNQNKKKSTIKNQSAKKVEANETRKQNLENDRIDIKNAEIDKKIAKIKSVFPSSVLASHPDISDKFTFFDSETDPSAKNKILQEILHILKNPSKLRSITDELGGADTSNPRYLDFKNTLLGLDTSFESYFDDLENVSIDPNEIAKGVEKDSGGLVNIDLKSDPAVSTLSLIGSEYGFDKEIDKQALAKLVRDGQGELANTMSSFATLKGFGASIDNLIAEIRKIWGKPDFNTKLKNVVNAFSKDIFDDLADIYEKMGVDTDIQIKENDITSFANVNPPENLRYKIKNIEKKLEAIKSHITKVQAGIKSDYQTRIEELFTRNPEDQEIEVEVLEFMHACGFDMIPKEITDKIILQIQNNRLIIPGLELNPKNIDLKKGHLGESSVFTSKEAGLNIHSKTNMVKFVNKIVSGNVDEPLPVKAIANGSLVADRAFLENQFAKSGIVGKMGWKYEKVVKFCETLYIKES